MAPQIVVYRVLRFNIGAGNPTTHSDHRTSQKTGDIDFTILLHWIPAAQFVIRQKLIATPAACGRIAIVDAIQRGRSETPVNMILLHGVGQSFQFEDQLIDIHSIRERSSRTQAHWNSLLAKQYQRQLSSR